VPDYTSLVNQLYSEKPAEKTVQGALDFTLRVIGASPKEDKAGLLRKDGGENIADYKGTSVSVSRICFLDGNIYKCLTDVPTTNGPSWQDNGFVNTNLYVPVESEPMPEPVDKISAFLGPVQLVKQELKIIKQGDGTVIFEDNLGTISVQPGGEVEHRLFGTSGPYEIAILNGNTAVFCPDGVHVWAFQVVSKIPNQ